MFVEFACRLADVIIYGHQYALKVGIDNEWNLESMSEILKSQNVYRFCRVLGSHGMACSEQASSWEPLKQTFCQKNKDSTGKCMHSYSHQLSDQPGVYLNFWQWRSEPCQQIWWEANWCGICVAALSYCREETDSIYCLGRYLCGLFNA